VNTRRLATAGLAVFASVALGTAACSSGSSGTRPGGGGSSAPAASASSASPMDTVLAAVKKLSDTNYDYTLATGGLTGQGSVDPVGKKVKLSLAGKQSNINITLDMIIVSPDFWVKVDFGGQNAAVGIPSGKWMHVDQSKIKAIDSFGIDPSKTDPTRSSGLFKGMTDAKKVDATHYAVTLDLTKTSDSVVSSSVQTKLGDKAKAVPAQVVLDDQGRLASVTMDLSSVDADSSISTTYTNYGSAAAIDKPAASDTVEAPDSVYKIFNS
jgi:hypothetical protein